MSSRIVHKMLLAAGVAGLLAGLVGCSGSSDERPSTVQVEAACGAFSLGGGPTNWIAPDGSLPSTVKALGPALNQSLRGFAEAVNEDRVASALDASADALVARRYRPVPVTSSERQAIQTVADWLDKNCSTS